jgi:hypothetical protein
MHVTSRPCHTIVKRPKLDKNHFLSNDLPTPTRCCRSLLRFSASYGLTYKFRNTSIKKFQNRHRKLYQSELSSKGVMVEISIARYKFFIAS